MLTNPTPITVEPIPAKVFDKLHVYTLSAIQPTANPQSGSITVELLPCTESGELANGSLVQKMTAPLTPEIMQAVPELAAAFAAVLAAIPATQAYLASQQEEPINE
jgi:uncharacterized protein YecA (UPF0149 family)